MVRSLLVFLFFLTLSSGFGQSTVYRHFPDSNAVWREANYTNPCVCSMSCTNSCGRELQYYIQGDTAIGAYSYHKIYLTDAYFFNGNQATPTTSFWAGLRQDTMLRKVYCSIPSKNVQDTLLCDFNLNVGDTLKGYLARPSLWILTVDSIDSVLVGTSYRKRINFGPQLGTSEYKFIEGVGFAAGLFYNGWTMEDGGQLICFMENSKALYPDSNCTQYLFGIDQFENKKNELMVFPNPTSEKLFFEIRDNETWTVEILDLLGARIKYFRANSKQEEDISEMKAGVYFVRISSGCRIQTRKIMIQH